jgi:hypothetical protein
MTTAAGTVAECSEYAGIGSKDQTEYATFLSDMLASVAEYMNNYTDRKLIDGGADTAITEYVSYSGDGQTLYPDNYPIGAVTSIHNDQNWNWGATTALDSTFYRINNERNSIVFSSSELTEGTENIKITYTAGYGATGAPTIPEDLALCTKILFTQWLHDSAHRSLGKGSLHATEIKSSAGDSVKFVAASALPEQAKAILDRYRAVRAL